MTLNPDRAREAIIMRIVLAIFAVVALVAVCCVAYTAGARAGYHEASADCRRLIAPAASPRVPTR